VAKAFAGNHGAGDNWHDWQEGQDMIGCKFVTHRYGRIQIEVDDSQSPITDVFGGKAFPYQERDLRISHSPRAGKSCTCS